ncbi:rhomboid family intramembrane serine protease [Paeniglutamicibacter cryotolerans]
MNFGATPEQSPTQVPVCPRHPDRVSYVSCQRCGRPACPDCQVTAAVGTQCVDCVRESAKTVPQTRTAFGGRAVGGRPIITYILIGLCVVVYVLQLLIPGVSGLVQYAGLYTSPYFEFEPWRMITSAFAHDPGSVFHILFNMYALYLCGRYLEPVLGRMRFLALYLISALGGSVGVLLLSDPRVPVVGASGAVFGLFAAMFVLLRSRGVPATQILVLVGLNLALGFFMTGISWEGHVGGLVTGGLVASVFAFAPKGPNRQLLQWVGTGLVLALLVALTIFGYNNIRLG